jgi:hypothetical protein
MVLFLNHEMLLSLHRLTNDFLVLFDIFQISFFEIWEIDIFEQLAILPILDIHANLC